MSDDILILASASPRRQDLLRSLAVRFEVHACPLPEPDRKPPDIPSIAWAAALAYFKARAVAEQHPQRWVLGADTVVECGSKLLGKPTDEADARRMLTLQAGVPSEVITGLALVRIADPAHRTIEAESTRVWMLDDHEEREAYVASGDWVGKAGAYGIQDVGDRLVDRIEGSFSNVVGLPLERLSVLLKRHALLDSEPDNQTST